MSVSNSDPLDEAAAQVEHVVRAVLNVAEAGVRMHAARRAPSRRPGAPTRGTVLPAQSGVPDVESRQRPDPPPAPHDTPGVRTDPAAAGASADEAGGRHRATATRRRHADARSGAVDAALLAVHREAHDYFRQAVPGSWASDYATSRGLGASLDEPWSAGYAPARWTHLTDHLRSRGWHDEVLLAAGLSRRSRTGNLIDHLRDRVVLPLRTADGDVVGFVGRCPDGADARTPKYLNSPRSRIFDKSSVLFGLAEGRSALRDGGVPVLVEGPLDAIAVTAAGQGAFVGLASCGTALTDAHIAALGRGIDLSSRRVLVATDHDPAGDAAAAKAFERLVGRCAQSFRVDLPAGQDPADVLRRSGAEVLRAALSGAQQPLLDVAVDHRLQRWGDQLQFVQGRVRAGRHVAPLLAMLPETERPGAVQRLAERLDLLSTTVSDAVEEALRGTAARRTASDAAGSGQGREPPQRHPGPTGPGLEARAARSR